MKKGFTLIELLAVIVVLAIIAIIAIPVITNIVEKTRKGAFEASARGYIDAVEKQIMLNQMNENPDIIDGTYNDLDELKNTYKVKVKGTTPTDIELVISNGKVESSSFTFGNYEVSCTGSKCSATKIDDSTQPTEVELQDENGNVIATWNDLKQYNLNIQRDYVYGEISVDNGKNGNALKYILDTYYSDKTNIKVVIKNGAKRIGNYAIRGCTNITSITIPNSVTSIGDAAFYGCTNLTSIEIPNGVVDIGISAFYNCALTSIEIPSSVKNIGSTAFSISTLASINVDDNNLNYSSQDGILFNKNKTILIKYPASKSSTSYVIPNSVTSINKSAFFGCTNLISVTIPANVISLDYQTFQNCTNLTDVTFESGSRLENISDYVFANCKNLKNIEIPSSVKSIGSSVFVECKKLEYNEYDNGYYLGNVDNPYVVLMKVKTTSNTINISESTKIIYLSAFMNCKNITSVVIPASVVEVKAASLYMSGISTITVDSNNKYFKSVDGVLFDYDVKTLIYYPSNKNNSSYVVPSSVTTIGVSSFWGNKNLVSITLHEGIISIGGSTFVDCSSLESVVIPNSVTSELKNLFQNCTNLTSVTIGSGVTSIINSFYNNNPKLTTVTFNNTNGWYVTTNKNATSGTNIDVTNPSTNVTYLKTTYPYHYFKRN